MGVLIVAAGFMVIRIQVMPPAATARTRRPLLPCSGTSCSALMMLGIGPRCMVLVSLLGMNPPAFPIMMGVRVPDGGGRGAIVRSAA
jgi:hypothetical protein